ncbi:transposase [Candidatus Wolfebacteria bacterium RIFCSPHIGHO2_01_FULL_48_22]|uniref:Transposase n=1 Tax=Candidatus Wolfebacteria bacterium RIFCSPHIGHO2_01_FULL_48_22 TaxID=1802555 RepID=A0A1F8DQ00_9BACT|nr:MAG: transposase [Candidatus Wolfebacteria bacterium RIFCSPHIGHO2_01_FULL_48_22]
MIPRNQKRKVYPTDLTDKQWSHIEPLIPPAKEGGRPRTTDIREILNAVIYVAKSGCDWRMLPHDFPEWHIVYHYFAQWKNNGTWKSIHDALRGRLRKKLGKKVQPTAGIIDSQSVKTAEKGGFVAMMLAKR